MPNRHHPAVWFALGGLLVSTITACTAGPSSYRTCDARIGEGEILTPEPAAAPRINGARVCGARPGKKFIYRIPCQGDRPMRFTARGLPDSLKLDAKEGVITGLTPTRPGEYPVTFQANNQAGEDTRPWKLVVGEKIALTPPVGYSSWGGHMLDVNDTIIRKVVDVFVHHGLADAGFQYICIDDGWGRIDPDILKGHLDRFVESGFNTEAARKWSQRQFKRMGDFDPNSVAGKMRDANGLPLPNSHFPDMKGLVDHIHSYGLKAGLYSSPGIVTCQVQMGSFGHEKIDARQFARWGFDSLKYDRCGIKFTIAKVKKAGKEYDYDAMWRAMPKYLKQQDRDIVYNLCQYGMREPWKWAPAMDMQSWRIGGDLNHNPGHYFGQAMRIAKTLRAYSKPGQWNDPDFMYIDKIKDTENKGAPAREIKLTTNERYQYVSLWSIICAPFFFSCDINAIDEFTIRLLGNCEIVNINQDALGHVAEVVREDKTQTVMIKHLADGSDILAVFNRDNQHEARIAVSWKELGIQGPRELRDVWRQKELGRFENGVTVQTSPSGCAVLLIRKP